MTPQFSVIGALPQGVAACSRLRHDDAAGGALGAGLGVASVAIAVGLRRDHDALAVTDDDFGAVGHGQVSEDGPEIATRNDLNRRQLLAVGVRDEDRKSTRLNSS